ncbi:putative cobalt transporter subunit CbtA [compost metagenome]
MQPTIPATAPPSLATEFAPMIKRIARTAGFSGLLAALLLTLLQSFWVAPLILEAETYESAAPAAEHHAHDAGAVAAHEHSAEAWSPEDGWQRVLSTTGGNLVVAVGFALILAALYSVREPNRVATGVWWGLAGFAVFCLAPTLGLPPELPGTAAADLGQRQNWWVGTAAATAAGLALLVFARHWLLKVLGAVLLVLPHVIGAPQPDVHESLAPEALETQFKIASWLTNAAFWVALGVLSCWLYRRPSQA